MIANSNVKHVVARSELSSHGQMRGGRCAGDESLAAAGIACAACMIANSNVKHVVARSELSSHVVARSERVKRVRRMSSHNQNGSSVSARAL
jgi:hypothetical protein